MARVYDTADFIVPPQVGNGQSERIQCRIQAGHLRALNVIARSGVFPYQQVQDVVRWCIKLGLNELAKLEPDLLKSIMSQANAADAIAQDHIFRQKYAETFAHLHESVSFYLANQMQDQARMVLAKVRRELDQMPDKTEFDRIWKGRYLSEFRKYEYLEKPDANAQAHALPPAPPPVSRMRFDDDWESDDESGD
jgi:hypothetical protein